VVETVALPLLVALVAELARRRLASHGRASFPRGTAVWIALRAAVLASAALFFWGTPILGHGTPLLVGDADGHAVVAKSLAGGLAAHGWTDAVASGFPIGEHYPPLGFYVLAALMKLGASPGRAVAIVALATFAAPPLVAIEAARAHRLHPLAGLAGALVLLSIEPYASYVGGWPVIARMGLVSQALGFAFACAWCASALHPRGLRVAGPSAIALVYAHPQVLVAACAGIGAAVVASGERPLVKRLARSLVPASLVAAALYGPGLASLSVPFGWPRLGWLHLGLPPSRLASWLEGDLLDWTSAPVLTAVLVFAVFALALRAAEPAARGALAALMTVSLLAVSGEALASLGRAGEAILAAFQPLRMMTVIPLAGAAVVMLAADGLLVRRRLGLGVAASLAALLVPTLVARSSTVRQTLDSQRVILDSSSCDLDGAPMRVDDELRARLRAIPAGGRFAFMLPRGTVTCLRALGVESDVGAAIARTSAVGAHVGVAWEAFGDFDRASPSAFRHAEALDVRWVLAKREAAPASPGWRVSFARGRVALFERTSRPGRIGAGCVTAELRGRDRALRDALLDDLGRDSNVLDDPARLTALVDGPGAAVRREVEAGGCDAAGARVVEQDAREPGVVVATVESAAPVDVVVRDSFLPSWTIEVDGAPAAVREVAPGFPSARLGAGRHRVVARVHLAGYRWLVLVVTAAALAYVLLRRRRPSRARRR
jgi:hypothetical protein